MITRTVQREDVFNKAIIEKLYESGHILVTLQEIKIEKNEEGVETEIVVNECNDIVYPAWSFEFTEEELAELNPQPIIQEIEIN